MCILLRRMDKRRYFTARMIATTGILTGILIILQVIGNYINPSFANINLSLIPIAIGAILYGPLVGGFLGLVCGVMVLVSPSTMNVFFVVSPLGTVLACLTKTTLAGIIAGFVMKLMKNHKTAGSIVASILVPTINTGIFCIFASIFFMPLLNDMVSNGTFNNTVSALFIGMAGINYIFEVISTAILTPSLYKIIEHNRTNKEFD